MDSAMIEMAKHTVLFVDDEESILKSLVRLFRKSGLTVLTAQGGAEALSVLEKKEHSISLIVSDQKMPGMNGAAFLEKARVICPDAMRFLLTGYSEMDAIVAAVNKGEIHRYLTKPWNDDDLMLQVRWGLEQYDLVLENRNLLALTRKQNRQLYDFGRDMERKIEERAKEITEKNKALEYLNKELELNFFNTVRALATLTEMHSPFNKGHGKRVSELAVAMGRKMELAEEEITQIEIAAILHDIGTLGLSGDLTEKHWNRRSSKEEEELYRRHPVEGQSILAFINRLDDVGGIIRHHHERYDGKGYPDGLFERDIPLGSRILAVADTYDRMTTAYRFRKGDNTRDKIFADLSTMTEYESEEDRIRQAVIIFVKKNVFTEFDPDVVKVFLDVLNDRGITVVRERQMTISELKPGLVLTRPIYSLKGRFILPHKTELTERIIDKLSVIVANHEVSDVFYILVK